MNSPCSVPAAGAAAAGLFPGIEDASGDAVAGVVPAVDSAAAGDGESDAAAGAGDVESGGAGAGDVENDTGDADVATTGAPLDVETSTAYIT